MNSKVLIEPATEPQSGQICRFQLENGLVVLMMKSGYVPVVAVDLWYNVGSRNEQKGRSGFAHLFEHMMFQGSENVAKSEHMKLITDVGGWVNGTTSKDRTNYYEVVPANQLELALWLEADRMKSLALTEKNFENQRDTVKEERAMRIDNAPYAIVLYEKLDELTYENWAYKHSVIGSMADLDNASLDEVKAFHKMYYRPNNCVMSIVGDVQVQETLEKVKALFGGIPAGQVPPPVDLSEPVQQQEKQMSWEDPFAPLPAYTCSYHVPARGSEDYTALEVLEKVLFAGESSRFFQRFVHEEKSLLHMFGGMDGKIGPGALNFFGQLKPGATFEQVEASLDEQFTRVCEDGISTAELERAQIQFKSDFATKLEKSHTIADLLCYYTTAFDRPELLYTEVESYGVVTAEDIRRVAAKYLVPSNRNVIQIHPKNPRD